MPSAGRRQASPKHLVGGTAPADPEGAATRSTGPNGLGNAALQRLVNDTDTNGVATAAAVQGAGNAAVQRLVSSRSSQPAGSAAPVQRMDDEDKKSANTRQMQQEDLLNERVMRRQYEQEQEMRARGHARLFTPEAAAAASGRPVPQQSGSAAGNLPPFDDPARVAVRQRFDANQHAANAAAAGERIQQRDAMDERAAQLSALLEGMGADDYRVTGSDIQEQMLAKKLGWGR